MAQYSSWGGLRQRTLNAWSTADEIRSENRKLGIFGRWSLLVLVGIAAYVGRGGLADGVDYWIALTALNLGALAFTMQALHRRPIYQSLVAWGVLCVFTIGGLLQTYLLNFNVHAGTSFLSLQDPELLPVINEPRIAQAYGLITLSFLLTCGLIISFTAIPIRPRSFNEPSDIAILRLKRLLQLATVVYIVLSIFQKTEGFGVLGIPPTPLPFHLVAGTLFYRQFVFPSLLLLGIWVFDFKRHRGATVWCVVGTAFVIITDAYLSTSRGDVIYLGLPLFFLWFLTGRFTRFRKGLLSVAGIAYFLSIPFLTLIRATRALAAQGTYSTSLPALSTGGFGSLVTHTVLRVGGAASVIQSIGAMGNLSFSGLYDVYRPSGLTNYFTYAVVGVPLNPSDNEGRIPTVMGLGILSGGIRGLIIVTILTMCLLAIGWRLIIRHFWAWPVLLAVFAEGALRFYSEGVPIQFYKTLLTIAVIEIASRIIFGRSISRTNSQKFSTNLNENLIWSPAIE